MQALTIVDVLVQLIAARADVDTAAGGVTPLYMAVQQGNVDVVERLIAAGADVHKVRRRCELSKRARDRARECVRERERYASACIKIGQSKGR